MVVLHYIAGYEPVIIQEDNAPTLESLTQQIHDLQKQNELLREKVTALEKTKLKVAIDRIENLEYKVNLMQGKLSKSMQTPKVDKMTDQQKHNRALLEQATCEQVCY